jgi:tRNA pseudouridine13 synthase
MGYAGLKDARATTRQTVSAPGVKPEQALSLDLPGIRILSASRHGNKLRPGHLAGNRFTIRVREVRQGGLEASLDTLRLMETVGVPNLFGEQRYGSLGTSHRIGRALLRRDFAEAARLIVGDPARIKNERWRQAAEFFAAGDTAATLAALPGRFRDERRMVQALADGRPAETAVLGMPRKMLRLYLSAYQSHLFDRLVEMRLDTLDQLRQGDLAYKHDNGACFLVTDPAAEQPRAARLEISPSGPLFGHKTTLAQGEAGIMEEGLLEAEGVRPEDFRLGQGLTMEGERRPLRVPLKEAGARAEGEDLVLCFTLPRGSYATSVLHEIMKIPDENA